MMKTLIVEDDRITRLLFTRRIRSLGHQVTACASAEAALEAYQQTFYPLIIVDLMLPGMDGLELCRRIRSLPRGVWSTILVITARDKPQDLEAVLDAGADDYLAKPVNMKLFKVRLKIIERQVDNLIQRKRAEESLRQYTVELQVSNEELDAFAHTVTHDLKGPLSVIVGFADMLKLMGTTMPSEEMKDYLHTIAQNAHQMNDILGELLLLPSVRRKEVEMEPLDMASIVAKAQVRLINLIEEYQAEIIVPESWPVAIGYAPWIEEVWVNYLRNALKYGEEPPRVELGASPPSVPFDKLRAGSPDVRGEVRGGLVRFWVRDNGPGLTLDERARLLTPFTQLRHVDAEGHGLGLAIVQRIIERHGGHVNVESKVGQGNVFSFTLPGVTVQE